MKFILKLLLLSTVIMAALLCAGHIFLMGHYFNFSKYYWGLMVWRCACYGIVLAVWPYAVKWIGKHNHWPEEAVLYFSSQRIKLFIFFVIIESLLIHNLVGRLFSIL